MATYKKINGQAISVTTEGHPQYYFQTKAQAEAALPTLEVGADVFVEEGGNEDVLPRVQELEADVSEINSNLSDLQLVRNGSNDVQFPSETTVTIYYTEPLLADHTLVATTPRSLGDDRVHLRSAYANYNNQRLYVELSNPMSVSTTANIKIDFLLAKAVTFTDRT